IITLNILCGFGVPEISNALLMNDEAVKKALTRSKASLRKLDNILQTHIITQSIERIETVQTILYLMFNEGYKTTRGKEAINNDLCFEAIRLAKLLGGDNKALNNETSALLALMFFNLSRFPARLNSEGEWLTLEEQDRDQWNKVFIEEGYHYLKEATQTNTLTRFHLEAIIASLHCSASTFEETNWTKISWLYAQLEKIEPSSPLIKLNRIIAESYISNSTNFIHAIDEISTSEILKNSFLVPATKGDIYKRRGEIIEAKKAYEKAFELAVSPNDKIFLMRKISQCDHRQD
ncbi:MAG: RNA polymerase sigma factor, partial [Bacteroidia bacterium]